MLLVKQCNQKFSLALRMSWITKTFNDICWEKITYPNSQARSSLVTENTISRVSSLTNRSDPLVLTSTFSPFSIPEAGSSHRPGKRLKTVDPGSGFGTLNIESNSAPRKIVHPSNMMYLLQASGSPYGEQNKKESILRNILFNTDRPSPIIRNRCTKSASKYLSEGAGIHLSRNHPHKNIRNS